MAEHDDGSCCRALADLVAELTEVAQPPQFLEPSVLGRLNTAFGRVRDASPEAYRSNPEVAGFHFQTDYFADPSDDLDILADGVQLGLFDQGRQ